MRRLRNGLGLTQTAMAEGLGISPSYLNLIERNQRPLTVQLLLKLASVYDIDLKELQGEGATSLAAMKAVFADPLLAGELPGDQELVEVLEAAPNAAAGVVKLYRAFREQNERLSDLAALLSDEGRAAALTGTRLPMDEVREVLERRPAYFARIDEAAEAFHGRLDPGEDLGPALKAWLAAEHGISVRALPVHVMPDLRRRYDRHSMRLFLSERLSVFDRLRETAIEAVQLALADPLAEEVRALPLGSEEARRIARFELARYAAHALMMPYEAFRAAAARARCDVDVLRARFRVSYEQAASRLVTLQRPGASGLPFFLVETDNAGNCIRRAGARGYPEGFGGSCPKLGFYAAFAQPGQVIVEPVEMPGGAAFLTVSRTLDGVGGGYGERVRRTALLLGCDLAHARETAYAPQGAPVAAGPGCRLCERRGCLARAEPPVTRPLGLDEMVTGLSAFDYQ